MEPNTFGAAASSMMASPRSFSKEICCSMVRGCLEYFIPIKIKVPPWYAVLSKKRGGLCRCKSTKFFLHRQTFITKSPYAVSYAPCPSPPGITPLKTIGSRGFYRFALHYGTGIIHALPFVEHLFPEWHNCTF